MSWLRRRRSVQDRFIDTFAATFCAAWAAARYDDYCTSGKQIELERPPIEDAVYLAERAWEQLERTT